MAVMNAQGRFALTAFSPLLFNVALIVAIAVLLVWRQDAAHAAMILAGGRRASQACCNCRY
jgi:putative peptidoglycan lipid II flippase